MPTGLLGTEVIPQNPLLNPRNLIKNIRVPGLGFAGAAPLANPYAAGLLTALYPSSGAGAEELAWEAANMKRMMSAQDVIDSHLSQENNYKTWDFGYQMSEADARAKGYIIPPDPTVTDEERKKNLTLPNIPPVFDFPQHTGDTSGQQVELPQHTGSPPVEWDFPIHTGDTSPSYVPTLDDYILRSETDEGLLQDEKVTSGILDETAPPFYSKIKKAVEEAKMEKGSADQWTGYINNAGVNQEELDWIGLKDYLADRKSITKSDVLNFVEMNDLAVQVEDIVLGDNKLKEKLSQLRLDNISSFMELMDIINRGVLDPQSNFGLSETAAINAQREFYKWIKVNQDLDVVKKYESNWEKKKLELSEGTGKFPISDPVTIERDKNNLIEYYIENELGIKKTDFTKTMFNRPELITEGDYTDYKEMVFQLPIEGSEFTKSHYSKYPNTFAHARFNTRDVDGKKTLFIEELQSDWIRKGRDEGFKTSKNFKDTGWNVRQLTFDEVNEHTGAGNVNRDKVFGIFDQNNQLVKLPGTIYESTFRVVGDTSQKQINDKIEELKSLALEGQGVVPDIPFKKNWQDIVLKRLIRYASENGFDAIAMTGGNIQADRYDLSKQIESLKVQKFTTWQTNYPEEGEAKQGYRIQIIKNNEIIESKKIYEDKLGDFIGKEMADKILKSERIKKGGSQTFEGLDLKVGGEGLKSMYDKIFSKSLNKIGKKFDAKLIEKDIWTKSEDLKEFYEKTPDADKQKMKEFYKNIWFMDLTPSMKKKAIEAGFPIAYNKPVNPLFQFA
jgi:hypothetical protein